MKKVCFVASNPFKPDPRAEKQIKSLSDNGYQVLGIGWDRNSSKNYRYNPFSKVNIDEIGIKSSFGSGIKNLLPLIRFNVKLFFKLISLRKDIDIIHSVNLDTGIVCLVFSKLFHKKIVYDIYDYYADSFPVPRKLKKFVKALENYVINNSEFIILPIDSRIKQIGKAKPKDIIIIYNTPNEDVKSISDTFDDMYQKGKINISFVGALVPDRFLTEILDLCKKRKDMYLHIAGFGNKDLIEKIKSTPNVKFYGKVSHTTGLEISKISDLMIAIYNPKVPNHKYSAPNKFYESLFLGKPIVVSSDTGIDRLVKKYSVGYVIDYSESEFEGLLEHIKINDLKSFKNNNQSVYEQYFSWPKMEKRLIDQYNNID